MPRRQFRSPDDEMTGQADAVQVQPRASRHLEDDDRERDRHSPAGREHTRHGGVSGLVVGLGVAPQALLDEEDAAKRLEPLLPAGHGLEHSSRERLDAGARRGHVFVGIDELR